MNKKIFSTIAFLLFACAGLVSAQTPRALTADDYARAERMLGYSTSPLVDRGVVRPNFLPDGRFWYTAMTPTGMEYVIINPACGTRAVAANMNELNRAVTIPARSGTPDANAIVSPDGKKAVFIKNWNLWLRDIPTGKETQLTSDGVENFGYATDNAGWRKSDRPVVLWSPDSKKIATFQQDQRNVSDMYLVTTNVGAPRLQAWKYPLPGDPIITIHRVVIEIETPRVVRLQIPPDARRGTLCDDIACSGSFDDNEWSADSGNLAFVSSSRDHKSAKLRVADADTGSVREVMEEK